MRYLVLTLLLAATGCETKADASECYVPNLYEHATTIHSVHFCLDLKTDKQRVYEQFIWAVPRAESLPAFYDGGCRDEPPSGTVYVRHVDDAMLEKLDAIAYTQPYVLHVLIGITYIDTLDASTIYLKRHSKKEVIRHEIGHAYNKNHSDYPLSVMYTSGGSKSLWLVRRTDARLKLR